MSESASELFAKAESIYDLRLIMEEGGLYGCPCFTMYRPDFKARGRCWRAGCDYHPYESRKSDGRCCVHVTGDPVLAERLRELLDEMNWYGGWALEIEA